MYIYSIITKQKSPLFKLVPTMLSHTNSWKNEGRVHGREFSLCDAYIFGQVWTTLQPNELCDQASHIRMSKLPVKSG